MNKKGYTFMAFAVGRETTEGVAVKKYIGVAPMFVLGVNPTKAELEKIYNREVENEPDYLGEQEVGEEGNKHKVKTVRLDFIVKSDAEKCNVDLTSKVTIFLRQEYRVNKTGTKVQVIDKYGRFAWVTKEEAQAHSIPQYSNGPANLDADYRPCFVGEEELTEFIKTYLNIPSVQAYVNNTWVPNPKATPEECEARLESIPEYFKGNFKEIKEIVGMQPNNKIKIMFGVRNTDDGKQFQTAYTSMFIKNNVTDYSRLDKNLKERKDAGAFVNTEFEACDIKEYEVASTDFSTPTAGEALPFDAPDSPWNK